MNNPVADLRDTIVPKSDQLNAEQLLHGPMTIRVTSVNRGSDDQPVVIHYDGEAGRPYKPCKSCRKILIFAWGENGEDWIGRSMTLFNKRDVKFGGQEVGGIRISHLSHIDKDIALSLTATRGKKEPFIIKRLDAKDPVQEAKVALESAARNGMESLKAAWAGLPSATKTALGGEKGCPESYKKKALAADESKKQPAPEPEPAPVVADTAPPEEGRPIF